VVPVLRFKADVLSLPKLQSLIRIRAVIPVVVTEDPEIAKEYIWSVPELRQVSPQTPQSTYTNIGDGDSRKVDATLE
jgi:hypothetical protein